MSAYNNNNQLVSHKALTYYFNYGSNGQKRYLTSITTTNHDGTNSESLPPETFEYNYSGTFKGTLDKRNFIDGGSISYNYFNKSIFYNGVNRFNTSFSWPSGYQFTSCVVKDNYSLFFLKTDNPVSGDKYRFKIFRFTWDGMNWNHNEFTFPHLIADTYHSDALQNFYVTMEEEFYGFAYDKGDRADVYFFHLNSDGMTWDYYLHSSLFIGNENPTLLSGNNFISLGSHRDGRMYNYVWDGKDWDFKQINQGNGQYYYAATNNFIIALNEDGGNDMITGAYHEDNYYLHYLDNEKNWQTKSWSASIDPYIAGIELQSSFYPNNSIIGFVAHDNPEFFLRWDEDYNITNVDNVLGAHNDGSPMQGISSSLFTIYDRINYRPLKSARFNGVSWSVDAVPAPNRFANLQFGSDILVYENNDDVRYHLFNPNNNSWYNYVLNTKNHNVSNSMYFGISELVVGVNTDFITAGKGSFRRNNYTFSPSFTSINTLQKDNVFTFSNGYQHTFVEQNITQSSPIKKNTLHFIDKKTNLFNSINVGTHRHHFRNNATYKLGRTSIISVKSLMTRGTSSPLQNYFYRIINDEVNNSIYDVVVDEIQIDDDNGNNRVLEFSYENPRPDNFNNNIYYEKVTIENKGYGIAANGKTVSYFNTGNNDSQLTGLLTEQETWDATNTLLQKTTNNWQKVNKNYSKYSSHYINLTKKTEEILFGSKKLENETSYNYFSNGQLSSTYTTNSNGFTERQELRYAHQQYPFVHDKNMMQGIYETKTKLNSEIVDIKRNIWVNPSNRVYISEKFSGPSISKLRLDSEVSYVDSDGNLVEANNGKGIYSSTLMGYSKIHEVATIINATHQEVLDELDVSYSQLQNLNTTSLKTELKKLYTRLPEAMISLTFYDDNGRVVSQIDEREQEVFFYYDIHGRTDYITDASGNVLEKKEYNFAN